MLHYVSQVINLSKLSIQLITLLCLLLLANLSHAVDFGSGANGPINKVVVQDDGKILVAGDFTEFNGVARSRIARLNADGSIDTTFAPQVDREINAMVIQPDGKVLIAGRFLNVGTHRSIRIARLNADGSPDTDFFIGGDINGTIDVLALEANGKILVGAANFTLINGEPRRDFGRLNADGTIDSGFDALISNASIFSILVQPDGNIIINNGRGDVTFNDVPRASYARLSSNDGSLDSSFADSNIGGVRNLVLQDDGKVLAGGSRLNADGTIDETYSIDVTGNTIFQSVLQSNGKQVIAGSFTEIEGQTTNRIARVNLDGSLDQSFDIGSGANAVINSVAVDANNNLILVGEFTDFDGVEANRIAVLNLNDADETLCFPLKNNNDQVSIICL